MGTKALALVVLAARQASEENGEMTGEVEATLVAAEAELEAIRKAVRALKRWNDQGQKAIDPDAARGFSLLESIAKEEA